MFTKLLLRSAGVDTDLLRQCQPTETIKYAGLGATVLFTAIFAALSGGYAFFQVFQSVYWAVLFGFIWGLMIFNLDRFLVASIQRKPNSNAHWKAAFPRLLLATVLAVVIAKPLELKLFQKEIQAQMVIQRNKIQAQHLKQVETMFQNQRDEIDAKRNILLLRWKDKEKMIQALNQAKIEEAEGSAGTKKMGKGPIYQEKKDRYERAYADWKMERARDSIQLAQLDAQLTSSDAEVQQSKSKGKPIINGYDGLLAQLEALDKLPQGPVFGIFLLFLLLELAPILSKLLLEPGEYDWKRWTKDDALRQELSMIRTKNTDFWTLAEQYNKQAANDNQALGDLAKSQASDWKKRLQEKSLLWE
ncbi:MAG: hypothetical protein CFE24_00710 [Flavobacterium sp. BFFFF2]|nr:MAG: hypothetical protein CFE24_00710 [Flavobacterium sp. BFFFF2]